MDDVVVVQGEWGRVEEITSAYVVIKIWDLRRLIVPLSWFIENAFANWTRESSKILTTSFLYLDYEVPVKELRTQLETHREGLGVLGRRGGRAAGDEPHRSQHGDAVPDERGGSRAKRSICNAWCARR